MDPSGMRLLPGKSVQDLSPEELEQLKERARMQNAKEEQLTQLLLSGDMRGLTLMNNISQDTFDEAVRENMEEFEMTREEAIADAIEQFERQGVSLASVRTSPQQEKQQDAQQQQEPSVSTANLATDKSPGAGSVADTTETTQASSKEDDTAGNDTDKQ